jgi:uncharacterized lipoprotein YajG
MTFAQSYRKTQISFFLRTNKMLRFTALTLATALLAGCQQREAPRRDATPAPAVPTSSPLNQDNLPATAEDVVQDLRTPGAPALTPSGQDVDQRDAKVIAELRSRIDSGNLSVNARNAKILLQDGQVVLQGSVDNAGEKEELERIVRAYVGNNFVSEIEVISK